MVIEMDEINIILKIVRIVTGVLVDWECIWNVE